MTARRIGPEQWITLAKRAFYKSANLARLCGISVRQLERDFIATTGFRPKQWLDQHRAIQSTELLSRGLSVKQVTLEMGFKHSAHFCRWFKSRLGITPNQYAVRTRTLVSQNGNTCRALVTKST